MWERICEGTWAEADFATKAGKYLRSFYDLLFLYDNWRAHRAIVPWWRRSIVASSNLPVIARERSGRGDLKLAEVFIFEIFATEGGVLLVLNSLRKYEFS